MHPLTAMATSAREDVGDDAKMYPYPVVLTPATPCGGDFNLNEDSVR
jgi:hypothetical protein